MKRLAFVLPLCLTACLSDPDSVSLPDGSDQNRPDASAGCPDPTAALPANWAPVDKVSAGAVNPLGGVFTVDATAGGFGNSAGEPYVYIKFVGGNPQKVDITDVASYQSSEWDVAFKRYIIRTNGGDSGPGGVRVASVSAQSLGAVTQVPVDGEFRDDQWATDDCTLVSDELGGPLTAVGTWYNADAGALTPLDFVYVLKLPGREHIKLEIETYYGDPNDTMKSAYYRVAHGTL